MKYHTLFYLKIGKVVTSLSSAAVVIGALRVKIKRPNSALDLRRRCTSSMCEQSFCKVRRRCTSSMCEQSFCKV